MTWLRRIAPVVAALLALVVVIQVTDVIACADESEVAEHAEETYSDCHGESDAVDCLCHVVFTPTAIVPEVGSQPAPEPFDFAAYVAAAPEVEPQGLDHVPLG